jgi:hypothetical protein
MTVQKLEAVTLQKSKRAQLFAKPFSTTHDDQVLTFQEWCRLNHISERTGRRIIHSSDGPEFVKLTSRRYGVTVRANREWQAKRVGKVA